MKFHKYKTRKDEVKLSHNGRVYAYIAKEGTKKVKLAAYKKRKRKEAKK